MNSRGLAGASLAQTVLTWMRLFRLPNLLIVALTQAILQFLVIIPQLAQAGLQPALNEVHFFLLTLVTLLIAGSGYLINDYYDQRIDAINKPNQQIIGVWISASRALFAYGILCVGGFVLASWLGAKTHSNGLLWLYPAACGGLWAYAAFFKKVPLAGNALVALFCAGVAGILLVAERESLQALQGLAPETYWRLRSIFLGYLFFAFASTMYREIVKDLEDQQGDRQGHCLTLPIWLGPFPAKVIATLFAGSLLMVLGFFLGSPLFNLNGLHWIAVGLLIFAPILISVVGLFRAHTQQQYHRLSTVGKWIMLSGLGLIFFL